MDDESPFLVELESEALVAFREAVTIAGSQAAFAKMIGVSQQAVSKLLRNNRPLPPIHAISAERHTGVPRGRLAPRIYPPEDDKAAPGATWSPDMEPAR